MGKTAAGAAWLSDRLLSAYHYWQFWRNTDDADVGRLLRLFTELPLAEIERLERLEGAARNEAKVVLANQATMLCHGGARLLPLRKRPLGRHLRKERPARPCLRSMCPQPHSKPASPRSSCCSVVAGLAASNSEARRLIKGGGARVNNTVVATEMQPVTAADLTADGVIKLSAGKKQHVLIRAV